MTFEQIENYVIITAKRDLEADVNPVATTSVPKGQELIWKLKIRKLQKGNIKDLCLSVVFSQISDMKSEMKWNVNAYLLTLLQLPLIEVGNAMRAYCYSTASYP